MSQIRLYLDEDILERFIKEIEADLAVEQAEYEHLAALHGQKMPEII